MHIAYMCTKHETNGQIPKTYVSNSTVCYYASMQWSYATFGFCENGCTRSLNAPFRMWKSESAQLWKSAIFLERQFQCTCKNRNEMDRFLVSCICTLKFARKRNWWKWKRVKNCVFFFLLHFTTLDLECSGYTFFFNRFRELQTKFEIILLRFK